ncbi:NUDIX hydrolase [Kitasatospora sp. MAP5-34]|uniref:NUDIX hydrolase n=1 Tax=Kitasatospora sp. MAP5-34 TaxID=3035102 RepID=UPI002476AD96|nr:NUDIX hydrolase [Kitasatospora sp. MAP5-34]MDH6580536.1 ADP-ribose pyrophosphatase [Kitasatospora sp. MAP5-34]
MGSWRTHEVIPLGGFSVKRVETPSGYRADYLVLTCPDVVAVLALTERDEVVLVNRYRPAVDVELREIPGGTLEDGEDIEDCAARELAEETGYHCDRVKHVYSFHAGGANSTQTVHLCVAHDVRSGSLLPHADPLEEPAVELVSLTEVADLLRRNVISDAATAIAVLLHLDARTRSE